MNKGGEVDKNPKEWRMKFWVNVDKPTKRCVIHREECRYEQAKSGTPLKGINELKRDGGWIPFNSIGEAQNYYERE